MELRKAIVFDAQIKPAMALDSDMEYSLPTDPTPSARCVGM
jgi:hypothetical protein